MLHVNVKLDACVWMKDTAYIFGVYIHCIWSSSLACLNSLTSAFPYIASVCQKQQFAVIGCD